MSGTLGRLALRCDGARRDRRVRRLGRPDKATYLDLVALLDLIGTLPNIVRTEASATSSLRTSKYDPAIDRRPRHRPWAEAILTDNIEGNEFDLIAG